MNLQRCKKGHFYDANKYDSCPHCYNRDRDLVSTDDMDKTEGSFGNHEPVVGWLVCTRGKLQGKSFELKEGMNHIGRAVDMDIPLVYDTAVTKHRHVTIVFDARNMKYMVLSGGSKNLVYINGNPLLETVELHIYDRILVGNTELMFVPLCSEQFNWGDKV